MREYLQITPEVTPGTFNGAGTAVLIDLTENNSYTVHPEPVQGVIRSAGAYNRRFSTFSKKYALKGNLNVLPHGSQIAALANWSIATATNTLTSYTVDHVILNEAGTLTFSRDLGMYVQQATFAAQESDQWLKLQLQLVGMSRAVITASSFAAPTFASFPNDPIFTLEDLSTASGIELVAVQRVDVESMSLMVKNILDVRFFIAASAQKIKYCGRDVTLQAKLSLLSAATRADYEATTAIVANLEFENGTNTIAFNMESTNFYSSVVDELDNSKVFMQDITLEAHVDATAGNDLTVTCT